MLFASDVHSSAVLGAGGFATRLVTYCFSSKSATWGGMISSFSVVAMCRVSVCPARGTAFNHTIGKSQRHRVFTGFPFYRALTHDRAPHCRRS